MFASNSCVTGSPSEIWQVGADGTGLVRLTKPGGRRDNNPTYSPNGRQVAFERGAADFSSFAVWVMNTDGNNQRKDRSAAYQRPARLGAAR